MKLKPKNLFMGIVFLIVILLAVLMYFLQGNTTFSKVFSEQISLTDVTEIKITRLTYENSKREEITITENDKINSIMNSLNTMELNKTKNLDVQENKYKYEFLIQVNQEDRFAVSFFDEKHLEIYDARKTKNKISQYEIKNDYNINEETTKYFVE